MTRCHGDDRVGGALVCPCNLYRNMGLCLGDVQEAVVCVQGKMSRLNK